MKGLIVIRLRWPRHESLETENSMLGLPEVEAQLRLAVYADDSVRDCQQVLLDDVGLIADGQGRVSRSG